MIVLGFPDYAVQAQRLAEQLGVACGLADVHRFPDGESKLTLPARLPAEVIFCRSLNDPNAKLVELLLAAKTARRLGAKKLTLVAPYLCYMRQDKAFNDGEAISQRIVGKWLADLFDAVFTVDPHLHRTPTMSAAVPATRSVALTASALIGEFLAASARDGFILGPDEESLQWVQAVAGSFGFDFAVCGKVRGGDREVSIRLPDVEWRGKHVVLVDDVASTGHTLAVTARQCLEAGASRVDVFVTHPLFVEDAAGKLARAGVTTLWSTDSVTHSSNVVPLAGLFAEAIRG